ncbi:hypothetical protein FRB99_007761 [Tulasnella sp. 403]|nr:hypothetical protein FRB99_007761 [Tulasnella sp. 403]
MILAARPLHFFPPPPTQVKMQNLLTNQLDDILIHLLSQLDLTDLHSMRLVSKRIYHLVNSRYVWINLLHRLNLPLPALHKPLAQLDRPELERLAVRAVRLERNWQSPRPTPCRIRSIQLDSVILAITVSRGVLFTAHKDGSVRCWRDKTKSSPCFTLTPPDARIVKFTSLQVCDDPSRHRFVVLYTGDSNDRLSYSGVFYVPFYGQHDVGQPDQWADTKGVISTTVSPNHVILAKPHGPVTIKPLRQRGDIMYSIDVQLPPGAKILRVHALSDETLAVATSNALLIYPMPSAHLPHIAIPLFAHSLPNSIGAWIHSHSSTLSLTSLTDNGHVLCNTFTLDDEYEWTLSRSSTHSYPHPVDRLSLTDMHGGPQRAIWVHWHRGYQGWPISLSASQHHTASLDFRFLDTLSSDQPSPDSLAAHVWKCTRSVSMPRVSFDQGSGTLYIAGISSPSLVICDYA